MTTPQPSTIQMPTAEDNARTLRYLRVILYTLIASSVVLLQLQNPINRLTAASMLLIAFFSLWLIHRHQIAIPTYLVPSGLLITFTVFLWNGQGMSDPAILGYSIVILTAGLLLGVHGTLIFGFASLVSVWLLYIFDGLELFGWLPNSDEPELSYEFASVTYVSAYVLIIASILRIIIRSLQENILSARNNELALEELNQELEGRVERRTKALNESREQAERLARIGRAINAKTTYPDILEAIVEEVGAVDYMISLNIFENSNRDGAAYVDTLAMLMPHETEAMATNIRTRIPGIRPSTDGLLHIRDVAQLKAKDPVASEPFSAAQIASVMSYDFRLGSRVIGTLTFSSEAPHRFGDFEESLVRGVGELVAAAAERSRLYAEQVELAEQLRAIDQMKSQFLASMSHELRTPLNAILNFTEFLQMGMLGPVNEKQIDALGKALSSGKHLLSLINDILDITKIESGMMRLFIEDDVDLERELATVIASANSLVQSKTIEFVQNVEDHLPIIVGDKRRIRQILLNLLANAIKFTEKGSVTLVTNVIDDEVVFEVRDTGPGIRAEELDIIFEPFQQTDTGIRHAGGTGLGLPITKRLIEAHGGSLEVKSVVNEGSSFTVKLPVRSPALLEMINKPEQEFVNA